MRFKLKLELEKIYKNYCNSDLESLRGEDEKFIDMMFEFVEFRLSVSGGNESSCMMSMDNVNNFLNEILLYENMISDWSGCYRGEFCGEYFELLEEKVDESDLEENIKNEILEGYKKENGMNEE
jgi:hypothetical protein